MKYRREIDGLRAIAVTPVVLFHAGLSVIGGGFLGVDIFFVISGFLITSILIEEIESGKLSILNFYERRARRILPAAYLVIAAVFVFSLFLRVSKGLSPARSQHHFRRLLLFQLSVHGEIGLLRALR